MTKEIIIDGINVAECENYVHIEEERYRPECNCRLTTVERGYYCDTYATSICEEENCTYKQIKKLCNEKTKYRSALEEIREKIKSLNKDICNNCGWHNTDNCQPNGYVCHDLIEIKNKINEVLNDT